MADDRPRGSCAIAACPRDPWTRDDGTTPLVCGPDVSRIRHWLVEIPILCRELEDKDAPEEPAVRADVRERVLARGGTDAVTVELVEVEALTVASALPAAATPGQARGGRVSGSAEPRLPISVDTVDLLGPARSTRRTPGEDDVGFLPVASTLDFWVQDLRDHRACGEGLPEPSTTVLAGWLLDRIDEAVLDWLPVDEFFEDLRRAHGALRGQLGLVDVPEYHRGIPCRRCSALSLVRLNGSEFIECGSCPAVMTIPEYEEHVKSMSTEAVAERKRAAVERRAVVRLLREMHAVGWRHTVGRVGHTDPDTGQLDVEALRHIWRRGEEEIEAYVWLSPASGTDLRYGTKPDTNDGWIGSAWLAALGFAKVHRLANAAGVLSVPRERAA